MDVALTLVVLVGVVTAVGALAGRYDLPTPLILILVGAVVSFLPFVPTVEMTADLVLFGVLPPLLYAAAIRPSLIDFRRNIRPIGLLSVGLVVFTTLGVGLVAWWVLPVPPAVNVERAGHCGFDLRTLFHKLRIRRRHRRFGLVAVGRLPSLQLPRFRRRPPRERDHRLDGGLAPRLLAFVEIFREHVSQLPLPPQRDELHRGDAKLAVVAASALA